MSGFDGKRGVPRRWDDASARLRRLLSAIDGFFPPGTPIAGEAFLDGVTAAVDADRASLVLVRMSDRYRVLRVVDDLLRQAPTDHERKFTERVKNHAAWDNDPVARRLHDRCRRRPGAHFVYATRQLARKLGGRRSTSLEFLEGMGVSHEITSLLPVARNLFSLLTLYRLEKTSKRFTRQDRRLLKLLHRTFAPRVVDVRAASIRKSLPQTLHATFAMLLAGRSEKEIAHATHRSTNTIHDHVKRIYAHYRVTSRPQLMARFIDASKLASTATKDEPSSGDDAW